MQILIVDDEPLARQRLSSLCQQLGYPCTDTDNPALAKALSKNADVALLDIQMPSINGLDLATQLNCPVIFCTAHDQYALQAFDTGAIHYLTKPVRIERLSDALARVLPAAPASLNVSAPGELIRVPWRDVMFAHAKDKLTILYYQQREQVINPTLKELEQDARWLRISRSHLVNPQAIRKMSENELWLSHYDDPLAISRRQRASVKAAMQRLI